jgi:Ca2+-binding EF-hand superfamily protein
MRSSAILSIAALASAAPSLAAPLSTVQYAKRQTQGSTTATPADDDSAALSLGAISTIAGFAAPVINGIVNHFRGNGKREDDELGAFIRPIGRIGIPVRPNWPTYITARDEESGALWGTLFKAIPTVVSTISGLFSNKNKREIEELFAREFETHFARELMARDNDESGAFWGALLKAVPSVISAVSGLFGNNKREVEELFAREFEAHYARELMARDDDESGAFWGALIKAIPTVVSAVSGLFGNNKRELELEQLFARAEFDESGAIKLGTLANIGSLIGSGVSVLHNLFSGNNQNKREFEELLARSLTDESGAIKLGTLANIGSLIGSGVSVLHNLFSGNSQNKREFEEILARAIADVEQDSGAIKLGTLANVGSLISSGVSVLHNLFSGNQKRDFEALLARVAEEDQSAAIKLGTLANIGSLIGSGVSVIHNLFSGNNKRELEELLAREFANDESGAIKLGTLANIGSLIGSGVSVIHNLFSGNKRSDVFDEVFARGDLDESGAIKLGTLANIGSLVSAGVSVIHNLFSGNNQNKREFEELLTRALFEARSLNELD